MNDILVIKIIFEILLSLGGLVLIILSYNWGYKYLIQERKCTSKVKGKIKKYTIASRGDEDSGIHLPIVYYNVNGKEYKVVGPEYKAYKIITKNSPLSDNSIEFKDDNQILMINRTLNSLVGIYKNPIETLYPINSEIDVYYNPKNPKLSYVLRYCNKKWIFWLMFITAILVFIIDLLVLILL